MSTGRILLSRDQFREKALKRDKHCCVHCGKDEAVVHHILERRLFPCGGYYLDNAASVCDECHLKAEMTLISPEVLREACGIEKPIVPDHLDESVVYDKWGNEILPSGDRLKGELFFEENVQKILGLGGVLNQFVHRMKYQRTLHLPWSQSMTSDDRTLSNVDHFVGRRVIVTWKMDGENTTLYRDYYHARSIDGRSHPSRSWVKNFWGSIAHEIPEYWRVCGENMYAQHSIRYDALKSYFLGFSIWNEVSQCLSWDETLEYFELLGIEPVEVIYDGIFDEAKIKALYDDKRDGDRHEGYVVRIADAFSYKEFRLSMAKFVRSNHVQTDDHWMFSSNIQANGLA